MVCRSGQPHSQRVLLAAASIWRPFPPLLAKTCTARDLFSPPVRLGVARSVVDA